MDNLSERDRQAAVATRAKRQAAGKYATPAQKKAFKQWMSGAELTVQDVALLATNPNLTESQRAYFTGLSLRGKKP